MLYNNLLNDLETECNERQKCYYSIFVDEYDPAYGCSKTFEYSYICEPTVPTPTPTKPPTTRPPTAAPVPTSSPTQAPIRIYDESSRCQNQVINCEQGKHCVIQCNGY